MYICIYTYVCLCMCDQQMGSQCGMYVHTCVYECAYVFARVYTYTYPKEFCQNVTELAQRERSKSKDCGGSSICEHQRERSTCKDCDGSGICEHQRRRSRCKDCGGSSLCDPTWLCVFDPFGVVSSLSIRQTFPIDLRPHECRDSMPRPQTVTWCPLDSHLLYFHTYIRNSEVYNMQTEVCRNPDTYKYFPVNLK